MPIDAIPFAFDVTNVDVFVSGGGPVPSGDYVAKITAMEVKPNSKADTGHNLALQFTITEGEFKGRKVFENLNIWHSKSSGAAEVAMKQLSSIGHAVGVLQGQDLTVLAEKPMMIGVELTEAQPDGINPNNGEPIKGRGPSNNILSHSPITADSVAKAQPHVPANAPVNQAAQAQAAQAAPTFNPATAQAAAPAATQPAAPVATQAAPVQAAPAGATPPWMK